MNSGNFKLGGKATGEGSGNSVGILACAGLVNAFIAALLFCRLPHSTAPSLLSLVERAAMYVCAAAAAGAAGMWLYGRRSSNEFPFSLIAFGLAGVGGWVWAPAIVLLVDEGSPVAAATAAVAGIFIAAGLRSTVPLESDTPREDGLKDSFRKDLFTGNLPRPTFRIHGYAIALCIYAAVYAVYDHSMGVASGLLGIGAFVFAWEFAVPLAGGSLRDHRSRVAGRLACVVLSALLVTTWALIDGLAHRGISDAADVAFARGNDSARTDGSKTPDKASSSGYGGYESIVLWPLPQKKQIVPPLPVRTELLAPGTSRPLIIRFDGAYWYFQPPETRPGLHAHEAQGTPLSAHIRSNNSFPLNMEAHQKLGGAVRLSRCREIQVEIESREDQPKAVALALLLADSTSAGNQTLYLGQQVLKSTLPDRVGGKGSSSFETLRFEIPELAKIRKFDEITVMLLPDVGPAITGPKIAVQQFQLFPR
jgi:hypothetical protein